MSVATMEQNSAITNKTEVSPTLNYVTSSNLMGIKSQIIFPG